MSDEFGFIPEVDDGVGFVPIAGRGSNQSPKQQALRAQAANPPTDYAGIVAHASDVLSKIVEPMTLTGMLSQPNRLVNKGFQAILPPGEFRNPLPDIDPSKPLFYPIPQAQGTSAWTGVKNAGADLGNFLQSPVPVLATLFPELRAALAIPEVGGLLATKFAGDIPGQVQGAIQSPTTAGKVQEGIGGLLNMLGVLGGTLHAQGLTKPVPEPTITTPPGSAKPGSSTTPPEGSGPASFTYVVGKEPVPPVIPKAEQAPIDIESQVMAPRQLNAPQDDFGFQPLSRGDEVAPTTKDMTDSEFRHVVAAVNSKIDYGLEKGKFDEAKASAYRQQMKDLSMKAYQGEDTLPALEKLHNELLGQTQTPIKGKLYSGVPGLDPGEKSAKELWDKGALFTTQAVKLLGAVAGAERPSKDIVGFLRNKLGEKSAEWEALQAAGIEKGLPEKVTPQGVAKWINENGPKVEVREFGQGAQQTPEAKRFYQLEHEIDTKFPNSKRTIYHYAQYLDKESYDKLSPEEQKAADEYVSLNKKEYNNDKSHWQSIAPKSEKDMPGYVEIAVVKPSKQTYKMTGGAMGMVNDPPQFPSYHNFPPNTLGFVRGYMENVGGKKVFHVIEVQSDWAKKLRNAKEARDTTIESNNKLLQRADSMSEQAKSELARRNRNAELDYQQTLKDYNDPLLPHYERLALKAAVDHAHSEGADAIAISNAETAMMTEGHDKDIEQLIKKGSVDDYKKLLDNWDTSKGDLLPPDKDGYMRINIIGNRVISKFRKQGWQIEREPGMRLHYDQTLPKIAGELTGAKGERVEMGEHRMAFEKDMPNDAEPGAGEWARTEQSNRPRKNLIFRNPDGTPKTSVSAKSFDIRKPSERRAKDEPFTLTGKMYVTLPGLPQIAEWFEKKVKEVWEKQGDLKELFSGDYMKSVAAGLSKYDAPDHFARSKELANDLVSFASAQGASHALARSLATDVLEGKYKDEEFGRFVSTAIYEDMRRANADVNGNIPGKEYWNDTKFARMLSRPDIQQAIIRHMQLVQPMSEKMHTDLGGKLAKPGLFTKAFINLIPISADLQPGGAGGKGPMNTLKKGPAHSQHRTFGADDYDMNYYNVVNHMLEKNYAETAKQKLYETYDKTGHGKFLEPGDPVPKGMESQQIQRRIVVAAKEGKPAVVINQNERLAIKKELVPEFHRAMDLYKTSVPLPLRLITKPLVKAQLAAGIDAGFHTGNMFSAINGAQRTGVAESLVGVREVSTAVRIMKSVSKVLNDSPEVRREIAKLGQTGVLRPGDVGHLTAKDFIPFVGKPSSNLIHLVDVAGRLAMNKMFDELVKEKLVTDTVEERRRYINALGQYNPRLMKTLDLTMRDWGMSTFITAGKGFNKLAMNRLTLSPGVKTADAGSAAKLRLYNAIGLITTLLVAPALVNTLTTGKPGGREGTKLGEIDLGPKMDTKDHKEQRFDPLQFLMLRRGMRITGVQALIDGLDKGLSMGTISKNAMKDIEFGITSPYYGPGARVIKETAGSVLQGKGPDWKAGAQEVNPILGAMIRGKESGTEGETLADKALGILGVKQGQSDRSRLKEQARDIMTGYGKKLPGGMVSDYADVVKAIEFGKLDQAKKLYGDLVKKKNMGYEKEEPGDDGLSHGEKTVQKYFKNLPTHPYTGSATFEADLILKNPKLYMKVRNQDADVKKAFFEKVLGKPQPEDEPDYVERDRKETPMSRALDQFGFEPVGH